MQDVNFQQRRQVHCCAKKYSHESLDKKKGKAEVRKKNIACCQLRASIIWFPSNSLNRFISAAAVAEEKRSMMKMTNDVCAGQSLLHSFADTLHSILRSQYLLKWLANRKMTMIIIDKRHVLTMQPRNYVGVE